MSLKTAKRTQTRMQVAIHGASGHGKTFSSLLLAYGLCKDFNRICVIDTEEGSSNLYAHLGEYKVITIKAPYTPEAYIEAIDQCLQNRIDVIIIDSLTHEWEGEGGILDIHANMPGNSFTNWTKITPRHNALIQKIMTSPCHVIATLRSKHEYVLTDKNGKSVPEKVTMKPVQKDGIEYDFNVVFELDSQHYAKSTKDRTQLFSSKIPYRITEKIGEEMLRWCKEGETKTNNDYIRMIRSCKTLDELKFLVDTEPGCRDNSLEIKCRVAIIKGEAPEFSDPEVLPADRYNF
jgi:hypothetical protein